MMNLNIRGKTALVTGSTSGIGKAIAASLAKEGASVIINGRRQDKVNQIIDELKGQFPEAVLHPAPYDLGTEKGCQDLIAAFPHVDILINNLGIFEPAEYFEIPDEDWFRFFEVNIMSGVREKRRPGHFYCERSCGYAVTGNGALQRNKNDAAFDFPELGRACYGYKCDCQYRYAGLNLNRRR